MAVHPAAGTTQPREDLSAAYWEWSPESNGLIGETLYPSLPVNKRKGTYGVVNRESHLSRFNTKRTPKGKTSESDWDPESATFGMFEYAHKEFVPDPSREDYMDWFDLEEVATQRVARIVAIDAEIDAADLAFSTTVFPLSGTTGKTVTNAWSASNGDPVGDILVGIDAIGNKFGVQADTLACDVFVYQKLCQNPNVRANLTDMYGQIKPGFIPYEQLAVVLGLRRLVVAGYGAVYNSSKPGKAASVTKIWAQTKALLTVTDESRDIQRPCLGRTFTLKTEAVAIDSWREPDPVGSYIRATRHMQRKNSPDPVGYLFGGVTA